MTQILLVALGGAAGSVARYGVGVLAARLFSLDFPWGTLAVNLAGCLAIGALGAWFAAQAPGREAIKLAVLVGVLGGFTTFSAFARETVELIDAKTLNKWLALDAERDP